MRAVSESPGVDHASSPVDHFQWWRLLIETLLALGFALVAPMLGRINPIEGTLDLSGYWSDVLLLAAVGAGVAIVLFALSWALPGIPLGSRTPLTLVGAHVGLLIVLLSQPLGAVSAVAWLWVPILAGVFGVGAQLAARALGRRASEGRTRLSDGRAARIWKWTGVCAVLAWLTTAGWTLWHVIGRPPSDRYSELVRPVGGGSGMPQWFLDALQAVTRFVGGFELGTLGDAGLVIALLFPPILVAIGASADDIASLWGDGIAVTIACVAPLIVLVLALASAPQIALPVFLLGWVLIILGALFGTLAVISLVHSTPKETDREAYLRDFTDRQERRDQW